MPVLLYGPSGEIDLVRRLATRLRSDGGEVRCYLEEDDYDLRAVGCKIAVGPLEDVSSLEAAVTNVHTFIPVLPDPAGIGDDDELARARLLGEVAASAAAASNVEQTIVPLPGISRAEGVLANGFAEIEHGFVTSVRPLFLLLTGLLMGAGRPLEAALRSLKRGREPTAYGRAELSILSSDEWVELVAAADDREEVNGEWEFGGRSFRIADLIEAVPEDGPTREPSLWLGRILESGLVLGSSAAEVIRVPAPPTRAT